MPWIEHDHASSDALVAHLVDTLIDTCNHATREHRSAWLALAGGRTPLPIYAALAAALPSASLTVITTDERCVPHTHPACNATALRAAFAGHAGIVVNPLTREDGDVQASLKQTRAMLALNQQPFDAVLLGMGADGHFASLFPGADNLAEGLALDSQTDAIATLPDPLPPEAPFARISLTLPRLLRASAVHLVITGDDKRRVLRQAQHQDAVDACPAGKYPVAALLHASDHCVQIHWSP
ncbi:6-phosphogluconolactonase [Thermomonas sp.]|uniref:6-phosphogluconolactonase n=1 Tax=Thermomonas sp. TaxID=1971895 RepID=UPI002487DD7F|nr:6-phosphogluconolactonase [Thermomonas sp.]MDI1253701.1 6-phosphogluconolactonase [Thermomonas sp.]